MASKIEDQPAPRAGSSGTTKGLQPIPKSPGVRFLKDDKDLDRIQVLPISFEDEDDVSIEIGELVTTEPKSCGRRLIDCFRQVLFYVICIVGPFAHVGYRTHSEQVNYDIEKKGNYYVKTPVKGSPVLLSYTRKN